jgi:hypothetical protein
VQAAQPGQHAVPTVNPFADRLRAHARLYRQIAEETWSEDRARELVRLAEECTRMADAVAAGDDAAVQRVPVRPVS